MSKRLQKVVSVTTSVTTILWLSGVAAFAPMAAFAATIVDGDIIKTATNPDVYIAKYVGSKMFKRLILNPAVFASYGHLKWSNLKVVTQAEMDAFTTSELVRATGDTKVYKLTPNGDEGSRQWVNMSAEAFTAAGYDWASIYTINTVDRDNYAAGSDITGAGAIIVPVGSTLAVSLASDTPAGASIPASATANYSATHVSYAKFNFTAPASGAVKITNLTVKRSGVGSPSDFSYAYLYDGSERLTSGKTVNSSANTATFTALNYTVPAGATKTLTLVLDISTNTTGVSAFEISSAADVTTDGATVSGSFPVRGNSMSLIGTGTNSGKLTVTAGADPSAPSVGAQNVNLAQFKLAAASEDINVSSIALYQGGTISNSNLSNFVLYDGSTVLATASSISAKNLVTFVLSSPLKISKGTTKTLDVKGSISGNAKNGDTIVFYVENAADVYGIGATYGFGVGVDITTSGTYDGASAANESNCTVSGGQLTFSSSGPAASNVRGTNVNFMDFSIAAGVNTELKSLRVALMYGGVKATASGTSTLGYITNIRIVDTANNAVVAGPVDLGNTSGWTDVGTTGDYYNFTDTITIAAGQSRNFKILADLNNSLSPGPIYVVLGSAADGWVLSSTGAKNTDNNQYVTDIVPSTYITGKTMTFTTSALTVALATSPASATASQGDTVDALGIVFTPGTSQTAKVTSVKVAGYLSGTTNNFTLHALGTEHLTDTVESLSLYDGSTQVGLTKSLDSTGYATFDNLNVSVPSSGKTLIVKAKISSNATTTGKFAIEVVANETDVIAYDLDNNSITPTTGTVNETPTVIISMSTGGTVTAALNSDYPSAIVAAGTSVNALSFKFYGTNQAMKITKMRLVDVGTNNISTVTLTYAKDAIGTLESKTTNFVGANADFTDLSIYIPKTDWSRNVIANLAISAIGSGSTSGNTVALTIDYDTNFEAVAAGGGTTKVTSLANGADLAGATNHNMIIRKAVPTVTTVISNGNTTKYGANLLSTFKVGATAGSVSLKKVQLTSVVSDGEIGAAFTAFTAEDFIVYRNGTKLTAGTDYRIYLTNAATSTATNRLDTGGTGTYSTSTDGSGFYIVFDGGGVAGGEEVITAGTENTYEIVATYAGYVASQDSITTSVAAFGGSATLDANLIEDANYYTYITDGTQAQDNIIWSDNSDGASHSAVVDATAPTDWINGYKVTIN